MTGLIDWTNAERPYENKWFAVERQGGWHRIVGGAGVVAVPFVAGGRGTEPLIVAVRLPRHATGSISLELPRGGLFEGEEATRGAVRETLEESGWRAAGSPTAVGRIAPDTGLVSNVVPIVAFEAIHETTSLDGETLGFELVSWSDFPSRVLAEGGCALSLGGWIAADVARRNGLLATSATSL